MRSLQGTKLRMTPRCDGVSGDARIAFRVPALASCITVIASTEGGVDIEEVAAKTPEKILKVPIDPATGHLSLPDAPGLGVDLNIEAIEAHPYDPQAYLNVHAEGWERRLGQSMPGAET